MRERIGSKQKKRKSKVPVFLATVVMVLIINIAILTLLAFDSVQSENYDTTEPGNHRYYSGHIEKAIEGIFIQWNSRRVNHNGTKIT